MLSWGGLSVNFDFYVHFSYKLLEMGPKGYKSNKKAEWYRQMKWGLIALPQADEQI